jgi:CRP-like cAMP-binding protein
MRTTLHYLTPDDERALLARATRLTYSPGDTILRQGAPVGALFLVRKGTVHVELRDDATVVIARLEPGDVFGEIALLDERHAAASYIAVDEVEAETIDGDTIEALASARPDFAARFFRSLAYVLADRFRHLSRTLVPPVESAR